MVEESQVVTFQSIQHGNDKVKESQLVTLQAIRHGKDIAKSHNFYNSFKNLLK